MQKHVIYRDRQELQAADLNDTQQWGDEAHAHLVHDAITPEKQFVGLTVSAHSATEISVAPGRLYDGPTGQVYALEAQQLHSVFNLLPLQDQKWLAISVIGQTEDTNLEPRDFLIDLQTREVEPQTVAMQRAQVVVVHLAQGLESPTPERPEPPTGYTLIAQVRLSPAGIQEVVLAEQFLLPNLQRVDARLRKAEGWILSAEPRFATMMSDMAALAADIDTRATLEHVAELGIDMARVKESMELPDDYVFYGADHYLDMSETDTEGAGYSAFVEEGVRMPIEAEATAPLVLANPLDAGVSQSEDGFVLPRYDEITRLRMETRAGELTINQYQYNTVETVRQTMTRVRIRYGDTRTVCTNGAWWRSGRYDPVTGIFARDGETFTVAMDRGRFYEHLGLTHWVRVTQFWEDREETPYWAAVVVPQTIQGSQLAQTLLVAQTGWCTSIELFLTGVAADGALNVLLCEARLGQPDVSATLASATLQAGDLEGGWNRIPWPRPVFLEAGKRYAVVLISGGAHRVGFTQGTEFTQGLLLYSQDGAYFNEAEDRDLMLRVNFARFRSPRAVIGLDPLQLAGGIHDLDLLFEGFVPQGTELRYEYQVAGQWIRIDGVQPSQLGGALLPLRAVCVGTTDLMPGICLTDSQARVRRFGAAFVHWSTERVLASPSDTVRVRCLLEYYDAGLHTLDIDLDVGGSIVAPTETKVREVAEGDFWIEARFTLGAPTSAYTIRLTGGTTDATAAFHVAERYDLAL